MVDYILAIGNQIKPRSSRNYGRTVIQLNNPASEDCVITQVRCHSTGSGSGKIKIFRDDGADFVLVAEASVSNVPGDNVHEVSLSVKAGDFIAYYFSSYNAGGVPNCDNTGSSAYIGGDVTDRRSKSSFRFWSQSSDVGGWRIERPPLAFADVAISRRWGDKLYLSGRLEHITTSDEICIMYMRPGSTDRLNLKGDDSDYTYFKNVDGSFIFENHAKYLDFNASGHYILEAWDVTDDCETRSQKRCDWFLKVTQPKYQYQLYFDPADPALGDNAYLLQEQIDLYNAYKPYGIIRKDPDCFSGMLGDNQPSPRQSASGWLCQAAEFLSSGCSPFPWWMCRDLTEWDIYMRGECSCDAFQEGLKDLGIPCHHLIAMHEAYGAKPPYCPYIQCP